MIASYLLLVIFATSTTMQKSKLKSQKSYGLGFLGIFNDCSSRKVMSGGNRRSTPQDSDAGR